MIADGKVVGWKDHITVGVPAQDNAILLQRDTLLGILAFEDEQISHDLASSAGTNSERLSSQPKFMESSSSGNQPILTGQTETFKKLAWNGWMTPALRAKSAR